MFGKELPFSRSVVDALADGESDYEVVSRVRTMVVIGMLASNEQQAVFTLAKGIAVARLGDAKVKEALMSADVMAGVARGTMISGSAQMGGVSKLTVNRRAIIARKYAEKMLGCETPEEVRYRPNVAALES